MPNFTIHELFTSMNAAASALDYRQKEQNEWTTWDWLCALNDGIKGSMSKAGYPYDNSPMESFFASLKKEYFYRREYATIQDVEKDLFYYIEVFYNRKRLHSSLGYMSPAAYRMKKMGQRAG